MPTAQHPQAKFDPIPPDLDLHALVERTPNFQWVRRIPAASIRNIGPQGFERLVTLHVIRNGQPLVIEKWNDLLPKSLFSGEWLEKTYNKKQEDVRDIVGQCNIPMTTGHYLRSMKQLTNQWTPTNFRDERRQRLYLKDIDCPPEWQEYLQKVIPPNLYYMNENLDERSKKKLNDDFDFFQESKSAAPAGDLMSSLPEEMRAQNLMCYIGHEGTYTPAHREMCASLGQNIMVDASGDENGEKSGSSIWFMTETKDREVVREYFLSMLGHDIEIEKHFAQINAWKKATFPVYIVEQKVGDFILVPPLAPHQVWNRGTRTVKVAWNRTTVETLEMALHEALPKARLVCRDEQYKNKAIIYYTLDKYYKEILEMERTADTGLLGFGQDLIKNSARMKQLASDFKALFRLYTEILVDEMLATKEKDVEYIPFDSCVTCSYCRANIFNRFLTCKHCVRDLVNGDQDTYDVCMDCYVMGRSCLCVSNLTWCEQWHWSDLVEQHERWRALIIKNDGFISFESSPLPLELARKRTGNKSVAQLCQENLRRRPWNDITKVDRPQEPEESEVEVDENGRPKKKKKRKPKKGDIYRCHVCSHKDYTYKLAFCSNQGCTDAYCYGVLYRAFDMLPQEVMQNERWQCPKCLGICNCGACRKAGNGTPYIPKKTLLGHDTRPIADDRSVESLVDFRIHNLSWLKSAGDETRALSTKRMQRLREAADSEKATQVPVLPEGQLVHEQPNGQHGEIHNDYGMHVNANVEVADMSMADESAYPDPSALGRERGLGMGYYDQDDDSPDKILFDPYQAPSIENIVEVDDEPEMAEYLKKQLRSQKRRARLEEDDDPDFRGPRSHKKKRKIEERHQREARDPQEVALSNMDPALFGGDTTMIDAPADEDNLLTQQQPEAPAQSEPTPSEEAAEQQQEPEDPNNPRPYSPNRPALRHAQPKTSYAIDENGEEEFDEIYVPRSQRPRPPPKGITEFSPEHAARDPLDLASAAIFAMSGGTPSSIGVNAPPATELPAVDVEAPTASDGAQRKRRGRPPRSATDQAQSTPPVEQQQKPAKPPRPPPRDRTRPRSSGGEVDPDLDAQLAQQLDNFDDDGEVIAGSEARADSATPAPGSATPKRRGRPPRKSMPPAASPPSRPPTTAVAVELPSKFMSMAERMRLKGKKIKIAGKKKSDGPATEKDDNAPATLRSSRTASREVETPSTLKASASHAGKKAAVEIRSDEEDEEFDPNAEEEAISDAGSPYPPPPVQYGDDDWSPPPPRKETTPLRESPAGKSPSPVEPSPEPDSVRIDYSLRSPSYSPEPSPSAKSVHEDEPEPEPQPEPEPVRFGSPSPAPALPSPPPPPPPKPAGPTIVRLLSSDDEEEGEDYSDDDDDDVSSSSSRSRSRSEESALESGSESESDSMTKRDPLNRGVGGGRSDDESESDSDDDDEDIPATKPVVSMARRGAPMGVRGGRGGSVTATRGVGMGRGRRRGRPRGRRG
ncbi:hypothetical protein QBC44DRAFT_230381 [Cladorrhinum sp. PSN332]|nr:hypothetical protein QBC44DRAFT_230381 [Cladorrhinum sp. PSN332]